MRACVEQGPLLSKCSEIAAVPEHLLCAHRCPALALPVGLEGKYACSQFPAEGWRPDSSLGWAWLLPGALTTCCLTTGDRQALSPLPGASRRCQLLGRPRPRLCGPAPGKPRPQAEPAPGAVAVAPAARPQRRRRPPGGSPRGTGGRGETESLRSDRIGEKVAWRGPGRCVRGRGGPRLVRRLYPNLPRLPLQSRVSMSRSLPSASGPHSVLCVTA